MAYGSIFKRYELKYILSIEQYRLIKSEMERYMRGDKYGESDICNLYCDTPNFLLIRRSIEKPFYKEKLRIRSYGVAKKGGDVFMEIKKKYNSVVYKRRIVTDEEAAFGMLSGNATNESQIGKEIAYFTKLYEELQPRMFISYRREAFYGKDDKDFRITFDRSILWRTHDLSLGSGIYGEPVLPEGKVLMEIKTAAAIPLWLVKILSENKIYKTSFSKYGTAYTLMLKNQKGEQKVA
ncbi:MAG: polyphosphate polymerase domain-containing protein [Clostridia bacterium]|nr:polyphosphate polymerase domain-containing protein [Clostridia bacterium]